MISIYNNLPANNVARALSAHYSNLQTSTQRLSSGLRVNGAADDAAGLAIRELMRSDIAALQQGVRNANDGISMLQTFDGALGVIDEKLIRMKELAEQAATGTYDSTQRLMIDSEFQAMGSEINRIARAVDFNGIKLLDGNFGAGRTVVKPFATATGVASQNFSSDKGSTVSQNSANLTPAKYSNYLPTAPVGAVDATQSVSLDVTDVKKTDTATEVNQQNGPHFNYTINIVDGGTLAPIQVDDVKIQYDNSQTDDDKKWTCIVTDNGTEMKVNFSTYGTSGASPFVRFTDNNLYMVTVTAVSYKDQTLSQGDLANLYQYDKTTGLELHKDIPTYTRTYDLADPVITMKSSMGTATYTSTGTNSGTIAVNLGNGDSLSLNYAGDIAKDEKITFDLNISGQADEKIIPLPDEDSRVKIHFGTMNDSAEDYYYIDKHDATLKGLGLEDVNIQTQDNAQGALVQVNDAIIRKDQIRAEYGAMQNRLENTITNLTTQAENLQAAESRISDADIAQEMMTFVRNQILANSSVAMLAQANSMPQMVMSLIH